jgi:hypothetical protein
MWGCFGGKKKARTVSMQIESKAGLTAQSSALDEQTPSEDTTKLAELRCQFIQAQMKQKQPASRSRHDQVVGYVDIPLYRADGRLLRAAGESYQVLFYDK